MAIEVKMNSYYWFTDFIYISYELHEREIASNKGFTVGLEEEWISVQHFLLK